MSITKGANKPKINTSYLATSGVDLTKTPLKQTHLNSFFSSAKLLPQSKKDIKNATNIKSEFKNDDAPNNCNSFKKDIKYQNSFIQPDDIDFCEFLSVEINEMESKTLPASSCFEQMDKQMSETYEFDKGLIIKNDLQNRTNCQENLQTPFVNQEVVDLCLDSSSEEDRKLVDLKQSKVQVPKKVRSKTLKKRKSKNSKEKSRKDKPLDIEKSHQTNVEQIPSKVNSNEKLTTIMIKEDESIPNKNKYTGRTKLSNPVKPKSDKNSKDSLSLSKTLDNSDDNKSVKKESIPRKKRPGTVESEKNECPPYKVIEGTTFAVDAFNYGLLKNVTTYFLTHFHTDHYVGLTKKFSMPIYASEITINLIRGFISVDEKLLKILFLNTTVEIEGVYVTAIDANHCPGAVMLLFQLPCGKRILHTGDFRWSHKMELNPYLNQEPIELIYLDTTHISDRHIISSQAECISKAIQWVREFKQRNENKRILYVVCTDVIGKENFWLSIAEAFDLKVWSDGKRKKALSLIGDEEILKKLVSDANEADLHVVSHAEAGFRHLDEYFGKFSDSYDMVLSIKPKGSDSIDPEFVGPVNSVSVRYSEHSTHKELRRFLRFLLPNRVVSTVPLGKNIFRCPKIPVSWHTKELYVPYSKQTSLLNYVKVKKR